jgi:deazaflavin-dependent oxidoreductase (nitroreductase family)
MKFSDVYNPLVTFILRSPLHGLMSGSTLLLTFTGRKSGQSYTTPISYAREGDTITLITNRKHRWWKNMEAVAPVTLWVSGQEFQGTAEVEPADTSTVERVYRGIPKEQAAQLVPEVVAITIVLN